MFLTLYDAKDPNRTHVKNASTAQTALMHCESIERHGIVTRAPSSVKSVAKLLKHASYSRHTRRGTATSGPTYAQSAREAFAGQLDSGTTSSATPISCLSAVSTAPIAPNKSSKW